MNEHEEPDPVQWGSTGPRPLMSVSLFAAHIGLPVGVVVAQVDRRLWPVVRVGKRVLINAEAVRLAAARAGAAFDFSE